VIMKRSTTAAVVVAAALVGAALAAAAPGRGAGRPAFAADGPPSRLIFGDQRLPITFSHAAHLGRAPDMECVD